MLKKENKKRLESFTKLLLKHQNSQIGLVDLFSCYLLMRSDYNYETGFIAVW